MKKQLRFFALLLATTMILFNMTGCATKADEGKSKRLIVLQSSDAVSLDPHRANDMHTNVTIRQIYDYLVIFDKDGIPQPSLAEKWSYIDDTTLEVNLKKGVKFHNGEELKASDVKFTFDRFIDPAMATPAMFMFTSLDSTEVIDDYTVHFHLKTPFAPFLSALSHATACILNEKAVTAAGDSYGLNPVGCGPFKFVEWNRNQHIILDTFADYHKGPAAVDGLTIRVIPEGATMVAELKAGSADMAIDLSPQLADQFGVDSGLTLESFSTYSIYYVSFDMREKPFDDVRVRRAINYAMDADAIVKMAWSGFANPAPGPVATKLYGHNDNLKGYGYDPEQAKALLAEAGYADGFSSTLYISDNDIDSRIATVVQAQLAEVGIDITLQIMEWGAFLERTGEGVPMFILSWNSSSDIDSPVYATHHTSALGGQGNRSFYQNPIIDDLLDQGRRELDPTARMEIYQEIQEIVVDDAVWGYIAEVEFLVGRSNRVKGFIPMASKQFEFYYISLD